MKKSNIEFDCIRNGRKVCLTFEEAHALLWVSSIGYLAPLHWIRFKLGAYQDKLPLMGVVTEAAMDFGMALLKRRYTALTLTGMQLLYPELPLFTEQNFNARAARFAKAFKGVPLEHRPYKFLKVYGPRHRPDPAYQMRHDVTWLIIFGVANDPRGTINFDYTVFQSPPSKAEAA